MISLQGFEKLIGFAENKWHNKVHRYDAKKLISGWKTLIIKRKEIRNENDKVMSEEKSYYEIVSYEMNETLRKSWTCFVS